MRITSLFVAILGFSFAGSAVAADGERRASVGITGGTLGGGIEIGYGLSPRLNLRGIAAGLDLSETFEADDDSNLEYDGDLKLRNAGLLLDFHPFKGTFRLSVGAMFNDNEITATGRCKELNCGFGDDNEILLPGDEAQLSVGYNSVAPYAGIGWGNTPKGAGRWGVSLNLGVMQLGEPDVNVEVSSANPEAQEEAENEERELKEDAEDFEFYPVVMLGVAYRF